MALFFEVYARYKMAALFIQETCIAQGLKNPRVLEIGSNGINHIAEFLPDVVLIPSNYKKENLSRMPDTFVEADATDLNMFEDEAFDFVISLCVLEHVPPEFHKAFFLETYRVAKFGVFHAAPFDDDFIILAEKDVSEFHKSLFGVKHRWIEEHLSTGHPNWENISGILNAYNFDYCMLRTIDINVWEQMYHLALLSMSMAPNLQNYINAYYNERIFPQDISERGLMTNIYIAKSGVTSVQLNRSILQNFRNTNQYKHDVSNFTNQIHNLIRLHMQSEIVKNSPSKWRSVLDFCDYTLTRQDTIYLYGVTPHLVAWHNKIKSLRPDIPVVVVDAYKDGDIRDIGAKHSSIINKPQKDMLSGKFIVVFPDTWQAEIFGYLESMGSNPVFYSDI
jgi:ubiquinone/menaquinone biosynthesis C-methylase UbiE